MMISLKSTTILEGSFLMQMMRTEAERGRKLRFRNKSQQQRAAASSAMPLPSLARAGGEHLEPLWGSLEGANNCKCLPYTLLSYKT